METLEQHKAYLDTLDLTAALWWFIENVNDDNPHHTELFFYLRGRVREEQKP